MFRIRSAWDSVSTSDNTTHKECKLSLCECVCGHVTFKAHFKQYKCKNCGFNNRLTKVSIIGGQTCVCALMWAFWKLLVLLCERCVLCSHCGSWQCRCRADRWATALAVLWGTSLRSQLPSEHRPAERNSLPLLQRDTHTHTHTHTHTQHTKNHYCEQKMSEFFHIQSITQLYLSYISA